MRLVAKMGPKQTQQEKFSNRSSRTNFKLWQRQIFFAEIVLAANLSQQKNPPVISPKGTGLREHFLKFKLSETFRGPSFQVEGVFYVFSGAFCFVVASDWHFHTAGREKASYASRRVRDDIAPVRRMEGNIFPARPAPFIPPLYSRQQQQQYQYRAAQPTHTAAGGRREEELFITTAAECAQGSQPTRRIF